MTSSRALTWHEEKQLYHEYDIWAQGKYAEYCNRFPEMSRDEKNNYDKHQKYDNNEAMELNKKPFLYSRPIEQVHLLYRHGDRTPSEYLDDDDQVTWSCRFYPEMKSQSTVLKPRMFRQGSLRDSRGWQGNCTKSQLTDIGHAQLYQLGARLRQRYNKREYGFEASHVHFRSTQKDRTMASALSLAEGMGLGAIHIKTMPYHRDPFYAKQTLTLCPWMEKQVQKAQKTKLMRYVLSLNENIVKDVDKTENWMCRYCHDKVPLPDKACLDKMYRLRSWLRYYLHNVYPTYYMSSDKRLRFYRYSVGSMLYDMVNEDARGIYTYATHDTTLTALLGAMNVTHVWTPYASVLHFVKYADNTWHLYYNQQNVRDITQDMKILPLSRMEWNQACENASEMSLKRLS